MNDIRGRIITDEEGGKRAVIWDALLSLRRVSKLFDIEQPMGDLDKLVESGHLPNFVELDEVARRNGVNFTPDLIALMVTIGLYHWDQYGAEGLSSAPYVEFSKLDAEPRRLDMLRSWLDACEQLADYHLDDQKDRGPVSKAFRLLGLKLREWDSEAAVACGLNACSLAEDGSAVLAAADALITIAGRHDDNATMIALTYRVLGLGRLQLSGAPVELELYDAFEAACRYPPAEPARDVSRQILGQIGDELEFLRPHLFLWKCAFEPDSLDPGLKRARMYAQPVWHIDDEDFAHTITDLMGIIADLENRRLDLLPHDQDAVAITDLNNWSIDHQAFRQAIPFANSLLREADRSDILLTLSHEVIHIESALGWLGINLAALRIAATECELHLLAKSGAFDDEAEAEQNRELHLAAAFPRQDFVALALVEQQLELVRKAQLLRAIWLPWLEGIAVFGELSADPSLDSETSTMFSDVISSLNDETPREVAESRELSLMDASRAIRADAERLYADALTESGRARLRTYLNRWPERYLAGYLAVRAVVTSLRRFHPFHGLDAYQALFAMTTMGTRFAVPSLTLAPAEFEAKARADMLSWLRRVAELDESSVTTLATAPRWSWAGGRDRERVVEAGQEDAAGRVALADIVPPLAIGVRKPRTGRRNEFGDLTPEQAAALGRILDLVADRILPADEEFVNEMAGGLGDRISLVPIGQVTAPFWLSLGDEVRRLVVGIRVTETERERGKPSYTLYVVPLTAEKAAQLEEQMHLLHSSRMQVRRYADISQFAPDNDQGRGLGRNVVGLAYGTFTLVLPAGQLTGTSASPSLTTSVENRLQPPSTLELDATVMRGAAIAQRTIDWIESQDFAADLVERLEVEAWTERVLALARVVLTDDDVQLVKEVSSLILAELGWDDGDFEDVCKSGLKALYDDDPPLITPLLEAALVSGVGVHDADLDEVPEQVRSLLFEPTGHGYDFRRFKGAAS